MLHIISSRCPSVLQQALSAVNTRDCVVIMCDSMGSIGENDIMRTIYHQFAQHTSETYLLAESTPVADAQPLANARINHEQLVAMCETHSPIFTWY